MCEFDTIYWPSPFLKEKICDACLFLYELGAMESDSIDVSDICGHGAKMRFDDQGLMVLCEYSSYHDVEFHPPHIRRRLIARIPDLIDVVMKRRLAEYREEFALFAPKRFALG